MKTLNTLLLVAVAGGLGFAAALLWMNRPQPSRYSAEPAPPSAVPEAGNAATETASARAQTRRAAPPPAITPDEPAPSPAKRGPQELLADLVAIKVVPGPGQARAQYRVLALLEQLAQAGPSAVPAIRQFLASNQDVAYRSGGQGGMLLPPSLRFGLFDVVRQIGGADSEQLLYESLNGTGRGAELVYLGQLLDEMAPGKYHEAALTAARTLLASGNVSDPSERHRLYDLLRQANDTSYVSTAQTQLVQADGKVDRSALRYLQQSLGEQSLAIAAQTYQNGRVADPASREALGRVALTYVGASDQALELFHQVALDPQITPGRRNNFIQDLDQDGLTNRKNPTADDLKIIAKRYALAQAYLQKDYVQADKNLTSAFTSASKSLGRMLERAGATPPGTTPPK